MTPRTGLNIYTSMNGGVKGFGFLVLDFGFWILEFWNFGILEFSDFRIFEILNFRIFEIFGFLKFLKFWIFVFEFCF